MGHRQHLARYNLNDTILEWLSQKAARPRKTLGHQTRAQGEQGERRPRTINGVVVRGLAVRGLAVQLSYRKNYRTC